MARRYDARRDARRDDTNNSNTDRNSESGDDMDHGLFDVFPSKQEFHRECVLLRKRLNPAKGGFGVYAARDIPGWVQLLVYPGRAYYNRDWNAAFKDRRTGRTDRAYAIGFFRQRPDNTIRRDLTLDPSPVHDGRVVDIRYRKFCGPYVNEPGPGESANAVWVLDVPAQKLCLYSFEGGIRRGQEVMACYGPGYPRSYQSACTGTARRRPVKSSLAFGPGHTYSVDPTMSYQRLYAGMSARFRGRGGKEYSVDLSRVHPRGWYSTAPVLREFFGNRPVGYRPPRVRRAYPETNDAPCADDD